MTKLFTRVLIGLLLLAPAAKAQPVVVRAGEHADFTRLVMQLPEGVVWELSSENGQEVLTFEGISDGFDLSKTFDVIPRDRIADVVAIDSQLILQLTCECPVETFTEQGNYLVVDVQNGPALQAVETPVAIVEPKVRPLPPSTFRYGDLLWQSETDIPPAENADETVVVSGTSAEERNREIFLETQKNLLAAFGEAVAQGVVDTTPQQIDIPEEPQVIDQEPNIFDSSTPPPNDATESSHIRVTTSEDIPIFQSQTEAENLDSLAASCIDPKRVAVSTWGSEEGFDIQISRSNAELFGELGQLVKDEAISRAKILIFFGFGAEALQTLEFDEYIPAQYPELVDISQIMEHGFAPNPRILHQFADCPTDAALWGILAGKEIPSQGPIDKNAALRALKKLPPHLRAFLGIALADRFLALGDYEAAQIATRASNVNSNGDESANSLTAATLPATVGDAKSSKELLLELITQNDEVSPQALIDLVDLHVSEKENVPADLALLVEAFAYEYRGSSVGMALSKTQVLASAGSGQFTKALNAFIRERPNFTPSELRKSASYTVMKLTENASDIEFVEFLINHQDAIGAPLKESVAISAGERLLQLGFAQTAKELLKLNSIQNPSRASVLLSAQAELAAGDVEQTFSLIAQMSGMDAERLRAKAASRTGDNETAMTSFAAADEINLSRTAAWLTENWAENVDTNDPLFGDVRQIANEQVDAVTRSETMLTDSAKVLESAARTRATISDLITTLETE